MKQKRKLITLCMLAFMLVIAGCKSSNANKTENNNEYNIYYINRLGTSLMTKTYQATSTEVEDLVNEIIEYMNTEPSSADLSCAKPEQLNIEKKEINNNTIDFYFNAAYNELEKNQEILYRAALVKTITQIKGINYVRFFVSEQPLLDSNGKNIGIMMASDYIENIDDAISSVSTTKLKLYFANEDGSKLRPLDVDVYYSSNLSLERVVVEQLIKGSGVTGYNRTLPESMRLLSISVKDGICYVNLDGTFLTQLVNVSDSVPIYSIVNSLTELDGVNAVEISVNGSNKNMFRDIISLSTTFTKNEEIVEVVEEIQTQEETKN